MIRAEKSTPNRNAYRTLLFGSIAALLIIVLTDPVMRTYDRHFRPKPWISAQLKVLPQPDDGRPRIFYGVDAPAYVTGRWRAWIDASGVRRCGGDGTGTYSPISSEGRPWGWVDFFDRDCPVPQQPFRVCVQYDVMTIRDVRGHFGPFCSDPYDPHQARHGGR